MKIAMVGFGKMGRMIQALAQSKGHDVVTIDPRANDANFKEIDSKSLAGIDVAIEFTHPDVVVSNIRQVIELNVPLVVGTTGWNAKIPEVKKLVQEKQARFVYGSNYSVGMNIAFQLAREAARRFSAIKDYEMAGVEVHHSQKKDSPSGTALEISRLVEEVYSARGRNEKLKFESLRVGHEPGTHIIVWDSAVDTVEITHRARNREGFAEGAILAAQWLVKQPAGFYTFAQCMEGMTK